MTAATPFLMFQGGQARAAIDFYVATVPGSRVLEIENFDADGPGPAGTVKRGTIEIAGQRTMVHDSFVAHEFDFTPSISFFLDCADEAVFDRLAAALGDGGKELMPPGDYGWSRKFAWVQDRFGLSWQLEWA